MPKAISHIRFSSAREQHGSSVERQEAMIGEWLARNPGYDLSPLTFKDLGKSGFKGEHIKEAGGFGKLLVAVEQGVIASGDVVLVEAIDRTGRMTTLRMIAKVIGSSLKLA